MMKHKELIVFLLWCFGLTWLFFGILVIDSYLDIFTSDFTGKTINALGAFMPTAAVVILLKKYGSVCGRKTIWHFVCDFPKKLGAYGVIIVFMLWRLIVFVVNGNVMQANLLYTLAPLLFIQIFLQGGFEEPGWRGFLQPYLEKRYPFIISVILVSVIWAIWHIPMWFIANSSQSEMSFIIFYLQVLVNSFSLAAIKKITNSVVFCILYHAWGNAIFLTIPSDINIGIMAAYTFEAIVAITISLIYIKKTANVANL